MKRIVCVLVSTVFLFNVLYAEDPAKQEQLPTLTQASINYENYIQKSVKVSGNLFQPLMIGGIPVGNPLFCGKLLKEVDPVSSNAASKIKKGRLFSWISFATLISVPILGITTILTTKTEDYISKSDGKQHVGIKTEGILNKDTFLPVMAGLSLTGLLEAFYGIKMYVKGIKEYDNDLKIKYSLNF